MSHMGTKIGKDSIEDGYVRWMESLVVGKKFKALGIIYSFSPSYFLFRADHNSTTRVLFCFSYLLLV